MTETSERMYKWLHSLAGLQLDFAHSQEPLTENPRFKTGLDHTAMMKCAVSTKMVFKRIWQRILMVQILQLQIDSLVQGDYHPDIKDTLSKQDELIAAQPCNLPTPKLVKVGPTSYRLWFKKQDVSFEFSATIEVPSAYPEKPPTFTIQVLKADYKRAADKEP